MLVACGGGWLLGAAAAFWAFKHAINRQQSLTPFHSLIALGTLEEIMAYSRAVGDAQIMIKSQRRRMLTLVDRFDMRDSTIALAEEVLCFCA